MQSSVAAEMTTVTQNPRGISSTVRPLSPGHSLRAVVLKRDLLGSQHDFFASLGHEKQLDGGGSILYLLCRHIDASHPVYLAARVATKDRAGELLEVHIPHSLVVAILEVKSETAHF
jgi:hypothetical protein